MFNVILAAFLATAAHACPAFFAGGHAPIAPDVVQLCFDGYSLGHSAADRDPLWSAEHMTAEGVAAALAAKRAGSFHVERLLPSDARARPADYRCSIYDKGHMTPVGDFGDKGQESDTFSMANMVPQHMMLNEGLWAGIEGAVRQLAQKDGELYVVTGPQFAPKPPLLNGRVAIPAATWKAVYDPKAGTAFAYVAANDDSGKYFVETVAALAAQIGFDPLPGAPAIVKDPLTVPDAPKPLKGDADLKPRACH